MTTEHTRFHPDRPPSADPLTWRDHRPMWRWIARTPDGGTYTMQTPADTGEQALAWARKNYPQMTGHHLAPEHTSQEGR